MSKFPILLFHRIVPDDSSLADVEPGTRPYCLSKGIFSSQMEYLLEEGYRCVSVSEIDGLEESHAVGMTFDDGFESDYLVSFPELEKRGFRATFYIVTSYVGKKGFMGWSQIKELSCRGMEIGSHSASHLSLINLNRRAISHELIKSKKELEDRIGEPVESFAVPFGFVNRELIESALEAGYKTVCTSKAALVNGAGVPKVYGRYGIRRADSMGTFTGIVKKRPATLLRISLLENGKACLKSILGVKLWLAYREKVLDMMT